MALDRVIGAQNMWLSGLNRRRHPTLGLTTLTALVLRGQSWTLAHVGDTRAYLLRDGQTTQLTQAARALGRLHRQSVIHRDVKPANLHRVKTVCCACSIWVWP